MAKPLFSASNRGANEEADFGSARAGRDDAAQHLQPPSRRQEIVRLWILLIPLVTALCGSAAIQMLPTDRYAELLPPLFFAGSLIVTTAMVHQRQLFRRNLELTQGLQTAHERLDTLHHLSQELSTSLNASQVAQTVLAHSMRFTGAGSGALWIRTKIAPSLEPSTRRRADSSERWRVFASEGLSAAQSQLRIPVWHAFLEKGLRRQRLSDDSIYIPISWKGEVQGAIFLSDLPQPYAADGERLLNDIALTAGPSLQNALLYQSVSERAEIDGLTRLINHRAVQERLNQELARVVRAREGNREIHFSLATLDITDFKLFNDTYGHAVGDEVLRRVSECLDGTFRISDVVGRFGGDEFLVLLPDTPRQGAKVLCERVVQAMASQPFYIADGSPITIRLSCGVATYGEDGVTADELLRVADERLYEAKRKGRLIAGHCPESTQPTVELLQPDWSSVGLLEALVSAVDAKDHYTRIQCERVWRWAILIAHQMRFSPELMEAVHLCSLVHDVGKIVLPDAILRKPGRLTETELGIMQKHTLFGAMIVRELPHLPLVVGGVRHHHEHWDGSGYPDNLVGEEIPLLGRVLAVADGFAAMTLQRPYRRALSQQQALLEIEAEKGKRYDPLVVEAFTVAMRSFCEDSGMLRRILQENGVAHITQENDVEMLPVPATVGAC